ncbi:insulinase family protein [Nocardia sp. NPDC049149]|uniref:insulinase family protein n=1 Tax=Nocardia sp. NPDC049149 TaxID=3364315 RepID=UPI0037147902
MTTTLIRPGSPLAWLRVRVRVTGAAADRIVLGRLLTEALPTVPASESPLHRRLALFGAVASVESDGYGMVVQVVAESGQLTATVEAISSALHNPIPSALVTDAWDRSATTWQWQRKDSEELADLLADLALHTPPSQWSGLYDALLASMECGARTLASAASVGSLSTVYVGPHDETALPQWFTPSDVQSVHDASPVSRGQWAIDVVSDSSALIRLGWQAPRRDHADFAALAVAAHVVGGHHRSWLTREFRTERGWAYSPWALLRSGPDHGLWQVSLRVPRAYVEEAVARIQAIVRSCRPTQEEHDTAVAHARTEILRLWSAGDTAASLLGYWQDLGLEPHDEKTRWLTALSTTTRDTVADVAIRWLDTEPHVAVVLG